MDPAEVMERLRAMALGAVSLGTVAVAERIGLFGAMDGRGPSSVAELSDAIGIDPHFVREVLHQLASTGLVEYVGPSTYELGEGAAACLARPDAPSYAGGLGYAVPALLGNVSAVVEAVSSGQGVSADAYPEELVTGFDLLSSPGIRALMTTVWLPSIPGMKARLEAGARVLDVGCGAGGAAFSIASAYEASTVVGIDIDARAIDQANELATVADISNVRFEVGDAGRFAFDEPFDLIIASGVLHNLPSPGDALRSMSGALEDGGTVFIVHPDAADDETQNFDVRGAILLGLGVLYSVPVAMSQGETDRGACVGPRALEALATAAGFDDFHRLPIEHPLSVFYTLKRRSDSSA